MTRGEDPHPVSESLTWGRDVRPEACRGEVSAGPDAWGVGSNPDSTPPEREYAWSERGSSCDSDTIHVMGEGEPQPVYSAKDHIDVFMTPRCELARRWEQAVEEEQVSGPCPMPWDVYDLGFAQQVAKPDYRGGGWSFNILDGELYLEMHELVVHIKAVGDLSVSPWSTKLKQWWPDYIAAATDMYAEFTRLVSAGDVTLYEEAGRRPDTSPAVLFDSPIPSAEGAKTLGWRARPVQVGDAWRSTAKTFLDACAPPWLNSFLLCPSWWPERGYYGRRITVNAYVDGDKSPDRDDLAGGSDAAVRIGTIPGGTVMFAYLVDLYDTSNTAIWVDAERKCTGEGTGHLGAFVVGADSHSGFLDERMRRLLSRVSSPKMIQVDRYPRVRFPKMEPCRKMSVCLNNPKSQNGLGWIAMASQMAVNGVVRTIALSPYCLKLSPEGNCLFSLFRKCCEVGGRAVGPISAAQILDSGLFSKADFFLRIALNDKWVVARDRHLEVAPSWEQATAKELLEGRYGLPDPRESLEPLFSDHAPPPRDDRFALSFSEPGSTSANTNVSRCEISTERGKKKEKGTDSPQTHVDNHHDKKVTVVRAI